MQEYRAISKIKAAGEDQVAKLIGKAKAAVLFARLNEPGEGTQKKG